jgi:phosphatidylglycerophosphate synthase
MWLPAFATVFWLLDRTQHDIATLALATHKQAGQQEKDKGPRITARLAIATLACQFTENYFFAIVAFLATIIQYFSELWYQHKQFEAIDGLTKKKPADAKFIQCCDRPSSWANNPNLLKRLPKFLSTRVLTSMTLVEIAILGCVCMFAPAYTGLGLAFTMLCHYVTDALDGAVGRFNEEGYVLWGYYVDHALDTLYECACVTAVWYATPGDSYIALFGVLVMALTVHAFHRKELLLFEKKLAKTYTVMMNGFPVYYLEWAGVALGLFLTVVPIPWEYVSTALAATITLSAASLGLWHIEWLTTDKHFK